jgi:hypothetical protein
MGCSAWDDDDDDDDDGVVCCDFGFISFGS